MNINFDEEVERVARLLAVTYHKRLIENIRSNKYGFSLSSITVRLKGSATPLIDTEEYISSIIVDGTSVRTDDGMHPSGLSFADLSIILEYGRKDKSIAKFPVWSKTFNEMIPEFNDIVERELGKHLKNL